MEERKKCRVCGIEKELNAFYRGSGKYGRLNVCKCCDNKRRGLARQMNLEYDLERQRAYYQERKEYVKQQWVIYYYTHKGEEAERKRRFYKNQRIRILKQQKRYYHENKEKCRAYQKEYYKENRENILKRSRAYFQTERGFFLCKLKVHRRRMRIKLLRTTEAMSLEQWRKIVETQKSKCNRCGKRFTAHRPPTIDHIIPVFHGGCLTSDNIQALCKSCNSSKHAKLDPQYIQAWNHNETNKVSGRTSFK